MVGADAGSKLVHHPKGELGAAVEVFPESRLREQREVSQSQDSGNTPPESSGLGHEVP